MNENYDDYIIRRVKELEEEILSSQIRERKNTNMIEEIYKLTNRKDLIDREIVNKINWLIYESFYNVRK